MLAVLGDRLAIDLAYSSLHGYRRKSQTISLSTPCIAQTAMFCLHRLPHASLLVINNNNNNSNNSIIITTTIIIIMIIIIIIILIDFHHHH